jgi:nucleoside-diphosphate kinase
MTEKCLVLIKPDGISRELLPIILDFINSSGLSVVEQKFLTATEDQCRRHHNVKMRNYGATEDQTVDYLSRSYIKNKNICAIVVEGQNAVEKSYQIKVRVRTDFGIDTLEKCKAEGRSLHNVMHSSETVDEAHQEIKIWLN